MAEKDLSTVMKELGDQLAEGLKTDGDGKTDANKQEAVDYGPQIAKLEEKFESITKALTAIAGALEPEKGAIAKALGELGTDVETFRQILDNGEGNGVLPRIEKLETGAPVRKGLAVDDTDGEDKSDVAKARNNGGKVSWDNHFRAMHRRSGIIADAPRK